MAANRKKKSKKSPQAALAYGRKRYQATYSLIKDYYKDLGQKKTQQEILADYHRIKQSCKDVPLTRLEACVDQFMSQREEHEFPDDLQSVEWYFIRDALGAAGAYFKDDDIIVLGLAEIGAPNVEFPYVDYELGYSELYSFYAKEIRALKNSSPVPLFIYSGSEGNVYRWDLNGVQEIEVAEEEPIPIAPPAPIPPIEKEKPKKEVSEADKRKTVAAKIKLEKEKQKTLKERGKLADKAIALAKAGFTKKEIMKILGL